MIVEKGVRAAELGTQGKAVQGKAAKQTSSLARRGRVSLRASERRSAASIPALVHCGQTWQSRWRHQSPLSMAAAAGSGDIADRNLLIPSLIRVLAVPRGILSMTLISWAVWP